MSVKSSDHKPISSPAYGVGATQVSSTQGSSTTVLEQLKQLEGEAEGRLADLGGVLQQIKSKIDQALHPIYPMYAATLTQVTAQGDLAEMKRLEAAAEQQLADHDDVAKALKALKAEIAKLS